MTPTALLPLNANIGGQSTSHKNKYDGNKYLTEDKARHIYKNVIIVIIIHAFI